MILKALYLLPTALAYKCATQVKPYECTASWFKKKSPAAFATGDDIN
jgi:hypothetical protein